MSLTNPMNFTSAINVKNGDVQITYTLPKVKTVKRIHFIINFADQMMASYMIL